MPNTKMIDYFKSLLEASRERLKNPILGTYTISFTLFNWRPLLFLIFSNASIEDKIVVINSEYCCWSALLWPLVIASIITFAVPYIMLGVDLGLIIPKKDRRLIKHKEKIIRLDEQITIATKEFEIQNRKSGTKAIESLQDSILSLENEKQTLQAAIISEREINTLEINKLNDLLKKELEKNNKRSNNPAISFSPRAFEMFNYLHNLNKIEEFYDHFDGFSYSIKLDTDTISFYKNLGIVIRADFGHKYSELGFELYHLIYETNNSKDIKREMSNLLNKLNNHEIQIIKDTGSDNIFSIQDGFRQSIIAELRDSQFIIKLSNREFQLAKKGVSLRNLIALNNME